MTTHNINELFEKSPTIFTDFWENQVTEVSKNKRMEYIFQMAVAMQAGESLNLSPEDFALVKENFHDFINKTKFEQKDQEHLNYLLVDHTVLHGAYEKDNVDLTNLLLENKDSELTLHKAFQGELDRGNKDLALATTDIFVERFSLEKTKVKLSENRSNEPRYNGGTISKSAKTKNYILSFDPTQKIKTNNIFNTLDHNPAQNAGLINFVHNKTNKNLKGQKEIVEFGNQ